MQGIQYNVDIVLCIDATGSMSGIIDKVKASALKFNDDLARSMEEKGKSIDSLRVKVIPYRDYYHDAEDKAMNESPFFVLPGESSEFANFVKGINADGGGDEPENGLEAVALAMKSDWQTGDKLRHVVVVWTDASAHPLDKNAGSKPAGYPTDLPTNFDELTDMWDGQGGMNASAKRIIVYSPDAYPWTDISTHWENTIHYASKAGEGMAEVDYSSIIDAVANSI